MKADIPHREPDWQDTHGGCCRPEIATAKEAYIASIGNMPGWAKTAMAIRNRVVAPFGLITEEDNKQESQNSSSENPMAMMGTLPVIEETDTRYTVGLTDRHLTFTLTTVLENGKAKLTTKIWFNNCAGRAYLAVVYIPHKLIVRSSLNNLK